jgi:hypothetical protein
MRNIVERVLPEIEGSVEVKYLRAFQPSPPKPEYCFASVVEMR